MAKNIVITVNAKNKRKVSPLLFGSSWGNWTPLPDRKDVQALGPATIRVGGNLMSRFNWRTNTYSEPSNGKVTQQPSLSEFVKFCRQVRAEPIIQLNALGWAPNKRKKFCQCLSVEDSLDLIERLNRWQKQKVKFFEIGNEPFIWHVTHPDTRLGPISIDEYIEIFFSYAYAIKKKFPYAQILGPAISTEWIDYQTCLYTAGKNLKDYKNYDRYGEHDNVIPYFLSRCAELEAKHKIRLLDYLSFHAYPMFRYVWNKPEQVKGGIEKYLESTQLWWKKDYINKYDYHHPRYKVRNIIPRFKKYIENIYPGTKLALTEFNVDPMADFMKIDYHPALYPLYLADLMGIAAQTGLDILNHFHLQGWPDDKLAMIDMQRGKKQEYFIFQDLAKALQGNMLETASNLPPERKDLLKCFATQQEDAYQFVLINKSSNESFTPRIIMSGQEYILDKILPLSVQMFHREKP
jgi:hypothetical protein